MRYVMGLDNSIYLHTRQPLNFNEFPEYVYVSDMIESGKEYVYELIYFRKSWAFRDMMYAILDKYKIKHDQDCGVFELPLTISIINDIQDELYEFLKNPSEWNDKTQVFYIQDVYEQIARYILTLSWLMDQIPQLPSAYITFVDSW